MKKVSDVVADFLVREGVKHLFMLTGGGSMHLADSIGRHPGLEYTCCLHEQACAFAAEATAEYRNDLGVAVVTTGPGGTNAVTGVAAAWIESASCLFLSGQAKRADLIAERGVRSMGQQEVDIVSVVRPITKYATTVLDPQSILYELQQAVYIATHGRRGPVWLDIPLDVQATLVDETALQEFQPEPEHVPDTLAAQVAAVIKRINRAERPVLFLGSGVRTAHRRGVVRRLVDLLQIPVLLTWKVADILPDNDRLYAGRPGAIGQRAANFTQQNADCLIAIGARLDLPQTAFDHRNFARGAAKAIVDIDRAELAKLRMNIDVPVCADAGDFIDEFLRQAGGVRSIDRSAWLDRIADWRRRYPVVLPEYREEKLVNTYVLMDVLSDELAADDLIVPGSSGPCSDIFMQAFRVRAGQRVVNAPGLGAMGTGLPGSIGACIASGRKRTICINGDGGFQLNIQELETVRRLQLPIKYFVLCNGGYGSIVAMQRNHFAGRLVGADPSSELTLPDVTKIAAAYGLQTASIRTNGDLVEGIRAVLAMDGPVVCGVDISDHPTAPRVTSTMNADGTMVSRPMEDMWPFLDRDELQANMTAPALEHSLP